MQLHSFPLNTNHTLRAKVETLAHISVGSESKQCALQASGALQCLTQCVKKEIYFIFNDPCVSL